jgi:hypothetical protein
MAAYRKFVSTKSFWREYESLSEEKRQAADAMFTRFKKDPFAKGLGTHKITRLSVLHKEPVWSVPILGNLRALFVIHGDTIVSISIGDHSIYK